MHQILLVLSVLCVIAFVLSVVFYNTLNLEGRTLLKNVLFSITLSSVILFSGIICILHTFYS